jgi:hypothetical protein
VGTGAIRAAVVGGHRGRGYRRAFMALPEQVTLTAICDRSESMLAEWRQEFPDLPLYGRYEDLLEADACDAAFLAMPIRAHVPQALAALESGKHVPVDVPDDENRVIWSPPRVVRVPSPRGDGPIWRRRGLPPPAARSGGGGARRPRPTAGGLPRSPQRHDVDGASRRVTGGSEHDFRMFGTALLVPETPRRTNPEPLIAPTPSECAQ